MQRTKRGDERGLLLVFFLDRDLVVPGVAVEEAEQVAARRGVDDLVNPRQPEGVLGAVLVEVGVVDAHSSLVQVLLVDEDGVGEPLRMDETTRISANGTPNLSTSVVVPGGLPRAIPVLAMPKSIQKDKNSKVEYNIYFITLIRVHLFGTCRVQVHRD
jgi:hypothetical protein